jgi:hypothetical protein
MRRFSSILSIAVLLAALAVAPASADEGFGLKNLDVTFTNKDGSPAMLAGSHPYAVTFDLDANTEELPGGQVVPIDAVKTIEIEQPPGFAGDPTAVPRCPAQVFLEETQSQSLGCTPETALGKTRIEVGSAGEIFNQTVAVYNLVPPPGALLKLGFVIVGVPVTMEVGLSDAYPYNPVVTVSNISQAVSFYSSSTTVWGVPASPDHDAERGKCANTPAPDKCSLSGAAEVPFITLPRSCTGPLATRFRANSWQDPLTWLTPAPVFTHDNSEPPAPEGLSGCPELKFEPQRVDAQPTSDQAESPSGLDFTLEIDDEGIVSPTGRAQSDMKKTVVTLPVGVTANPSMAEGLAVCSQAGFDAESLSSQPGEGCPQASKIGTVEAESPLLKDQLLAGQIFIAEPYANPYGELLALYLVIRDPELGILVKLPGKVEPDPRTGQLVTTFGEAPYEIPQFPVSRLRVRLREGGRSPLITPPTCGAHEVKSELTPWADPADPIVKTSVFQIGSGVAGGPCPTGMPPFEPGFGAGTLSNDAGSHSPFFMRLTRRDADQDLTRFAASLPPGLVAKLAGTAQCPDAAIVAAKGKSGNQEKASPSCPAGSRLGSVTAGAGVGSQLTYVPGSLYLAGPYNGAPLSVAAIVPAVAGPFDVGTVVTRVALRIHPRTAKVTVDGAASDPIPHILAGIPLKVRDIRVNVDRPAFTLNPTSCDPFEVGAQIWGGGVDVFGSQDDVSILRSDRFQAANCAGLPFAPRLSLRLEGGTKRGGHPALTGTYRPQAGDANLAGLVLRFPRSAFLDQGHIRTICTRVQFAAEACPPGAIYGKATAHTPLLEQPLSGPVYLRSSDNKLPDFVADLRGVIDVEAVARIDSVKGGIRATFTEVPDAPLTKVVVRMQGGKKGLIENSANLCRGKRRANVGFSAHNGNTRKARPVVLAAGCKGRGGRGVGRKAK